MSARTDLADALTATLSAADTDATFVVVTDVAGIPNLDPSVTAYLQVIRTGLEPAAELGAWWHDFTVWLVVPTTGAETVDDDLDAAIEIALPILDAQRYLIDVRAERDTHPSNWAAYRITCRTRGLTT